MSSFGARRVGYAVLGVAAVLLLAGAGLWVALKPPPEPDWRQAIEQAQADGDCERVFAISSSAASVRVPGAMDLWMRIFGMPMLAGGGPGCAPSWRALLPGPADDESLAAFKDDVQRFAEGGTGRGAGRGAGDGAGWGAARRVPGTFATAFAALRGYELVPDYPSGYYRPEPVFAALGLRQRVRLAWLQLRCDAVWNADKPNWRIVEADIRGDMQGAWQAFDTRCGAAALALVAAIGPHARGGPGQAVDRLLDYSGRLTGSRYLSARRLLVDGIVRPYAAGEPEFVASLHMSAFSDLSFAILDGHGGAMALYGRMLMEGVEQRYGTRRMSAVFDRPDMSDTQYAFGLLTLAQVAGEDVEDDRARAAAALTEVEKAVVMDWVKGE